MCNSVSHNHGHSHVHLPAAKPGQPLANPEKAYRVETITHADGSSELVSVSGTAQTITRDEVD